MMNREEALVILKDTVTERSLMQHSLAAEAVMNGLAGHFGEDAEKWGLTGLLHDLDYPQTADEPARHGLLTAEMLAGKLPDDALQAIRAHNGEMNGTAVLSRFDTALRCGETVTGLITAASLVRPTGIDGMQVSSIKKKMKDPPFAASVNRDVIRECTDIGLSLEEFLGIAINAMAERGDELGLKKPVPAA